MDFLQLENWRNQGYVIKVEEAKHSKEAFLMMHIVCGDIHTSSTLT